MSNAKNHKITGDFEYEVITEVLSQRGKGYAVTIAKNLSKNNGKKVQVGSIHTTLSRLEDKGFISSTMSDPIAERGGRPRRLYTISGEGIQAMRNRESQVRRVYAKPLGLGGVA